MMLTPPAEAARFPPRERGWSQKRPGPEYRSSVSPARAGMVPDQGHAVDIHGRFPRASGDGPRITLEEGIDVVFPPRERGWSLRAGRATPRLPVSPARAGMVPHTRHPHGLHARFPRASGDGPRTAQGGKAPGEFPPRERGWSLKQGIPIARAVVSPARAGMVPRLVADCRRRMCFPRASGDGPSTATLPCGISAFPPRERGWTPDAARVGQVRRVPPARAGMDIG